MKIYEDTNGSIELNDERLTITKQGKTLKLGFVYKLGGIMAWTKNEKEKDRFRKTDSWSIPYEVYKYLPGDSVINFTTENGCYSIKKSAITEYMKYNDVFLWFKKSGVEKKIYIPVKLWNFK